MHGIVNCVAYKQGQSAGQIGLDEIDDLLAQPDTFVWLGLLEPDEQLMNKIKRKFALHELAVEDAHRAHQRPKLESYGESLFVVLHTAKLQEEKVYFGETHIFIGKNYVIAIRHGSTLSYKSVRSRLEASPQHLVKGPGFVFYALMDFIVDNYLPIIDSFETDIEKLETDIFQGTFNRNTIKHLYDFKRELVTLSKAVWPLLNICNQLINLDFALIPSEIKPYFRDVHDHAIRINESIEVMQEVLTTALQVNLALVTVGQNDVVRRLAGWGAILAVPTMITSVYGMNFKFMPELNWHYGYHAILLVTLGICFFLYRWLRKIGWL